MVKYHRTFNTVYIIFLFSQVIRADMIVSYANESELPYNLSSSNYPNSPSKYSNSASNYSNSSLNYLNSSARYENSFLNYKNGRNGDRRLLREESGTYHYIGYYVRNDDGLINFFSSKGDRLFYSPPGTGAIFHSEKGDYCGTLATLNDKSVLVISEKGQIVLLEKANTIYNEQINMKKSITDTYPGIGSGHWIKENVNGGSIIILEDGSIWAIDPVDRIDAMLWLPISSITVIESAKGTPGYNYLLINTDDGEKAHAKYTGLK